MFYPRSAVCGEELLRFTLTSWLTWWGLDFPPHIGLQVMACRRCNTSSFTLWQPILDRFCSTDVTMHTRRLVYNAASSVWRDSRLTARQSDFETEINLGWKLQPTFKGKLFENYYKKVLKKPRKRGEKAQNGRLNGRNSKLLVPSLPMPPEVPWLGADWCWLHGKASWPPDPSHQKNNIVVGNFVVGIIFNFVMV